MKITPLILFLILLIVLVLSILFSNFLPLSNTKESFVSFNQNKQPIDYVAIPQYSPSSHSVVKIYDNVFFDTTNGNLIEVDGTAYVSGNTVSGNTSTSGTRDNTGISITGIYVTKRDGTTNQNPYTTTFTDATKTNVRANTTDESKINNVNSQYNSWLYNTKSSNTDKYQIFYVSWNTNTFIHVVKLGSTPTHIASFVFGSGSVMEIFVYPGSQSITAGTPAADTDTNNGKYIVEGLYDSTNNVYQISHTVKYDLINGNMIVKTDGTPATLTVYNRYGNTISDYASNKLTTLPNTSFIPWIKSDAANNMVLYMPFSTKTVIILLKLDSTTGGGFRMSNVLRFTSTGVDTGSGSGTGSISGTGAGIGTGSSSIAGGGGTGPNSEYYRWLAYWNTIVNTPSSDYSQDFLLKSQIVPPVCPSCPSCPSTGGNGGGTCSNCGGKGGSGTIGAGGASVVSGNTVVGGAALSSGDKQFDATAKTNGQFATTANTNTLGGATTTQALGVVSGVENVASTGAGVITGTVGTAGDVLKSTGSGAANLAGKVIDTTSGLLKDAGSGAVNLLKDAGNRGSQGGYGSEGTGYGSGVAGYSGAPSMGRSGVNGIDNYSYYGALPSKGGNFIPITSDFSKFSK